LVTTGVGNKRLTSDLNTTQCATRVEQMYQVDRAAKQKLERKKQEREREGVITHTHKKNRKPYAKPRSIQQYAIYKHLHTYTHTHTHTHTHTYFRLRGAHACRGPTVHGAVEANAAGRRPPVLPTVEPMANPAEGGFPGPANEERVS
jgi:hypothetical protein